MNTIKKIDEYLDGTDWRRKENASVGFSLQGLNAFLVGSASSEYWLDKIYDKEIDKMHRSGDMHVHDLGLLSPYCAGWDLKDVLIRGLGGAPDKVTCLPAKHLRTAVGQLVNFFTILTGEAAGAQAISSFDTLLAPFVRYDKLDYNEVKQCMQEFVYALNIPTRIGQQSVFSNITLDLTAADSAIASEAVIIGGKPQKEQYKDFQKEMDVINLCLTEVFISGDGAQSIFSFPIPTINITKSFNWDSDVARNIFQATAKFGLFYFANYMNSGMEPSDSRSMCCRLKLDLKEIKRRGAGLFGSNPLVGSTGVVTINLPRLGYTSKTEDEFFEKLKYVMNVAKRALIKKRETLEEYALMGLYPYSVYYLDSVYKRFKKYFHNYFSTIGLIGMNEMLLNFEPIKKNIGSVEGSAFAKKVLNFMNGEILKYQRETNVLWNVEATPAEGTTRRLANLDKLRFKNIITANDNDKNEAVFYTNSSQLPVNYTDDLIEALDLQDDLQSLYSGGTLMNAYVGEALPSYISVKKLVQLVVTNYKLPYFCITPTFSICPVHGYLSGSHKYCPKCDQEIGHTDK